MEDENTVFSVEETISTFNDRNIGRKGPYARDSSRNKKTPRSRSLWAPISTSRIDREKKEKLLFLTETGSDISIATWQPAVPGILKKASAKASQPTNCNRGSESKRYDNIRNKSKNRDSYVGGKLKSSYSGQDTSNGNSVKFKRETEPSQYLRQEYSVSECSGKTYDYTDDTVVTNFTSDEEVYYVKQSYGYFSMFISVVQIFVFAGMTVMCGVAPLSINPMVGPYPDSLSLWGAKNAYEIIYQNQWWRTISGSMLHVGVIHLFCNIALQIETAAFFEREWGSIKWLVIYISASFGSTITACAAHPESISVVSSGAIMGLFGAKLAEVVCSLCEKIESKQQKINKEVRIEQLSGLLCSSSLLSLFSFVPFIDWSAHFGGLCTGFLAGIILFSGSIRPTALKVYGYFVGIGTLVSSTYILFNYMLTGMELSESLADVCDYYQTYFWNDYVCNCGS